MSDNEIKALVAKYLKLRVKTHKDVIKATGIPQATYYRRLSNPNDLKLEELRAIFDYLKTPQTERNI